MDRQQQLLVLITALVFIGAMIVAAYLSAGGGAGAPAGLRPDQRFTARPGTTREGAIALSTRKRPETERQESIASGGNGAPIPVRSLSGDGPPEEPPTLGRRLFEEAMQAPGAAPEALARIEAAIAEEQDAEGETALLHAARGRLLAQQGAAFHADAEAAFAAARDADRRETHAQEIAEAHARALASWGAHEAAAAMIEESLAAADSQEGGFGSRALLGELLEARGTPDAAIASYREALEAALADAAPGDPADREAVRLIGMRLARLHRQADEHEAADTVARRVAAWIEGAR